jgi:hypothetical protein
MLAELIQRDFKDNNIGLYAASLTRRASFDSVARLSFLPEPLAASIIEFHDIPRFSPLAPLPLRVPVLPTIDAGGGGERDPQRMLFS